MESGPAEAIAADRLANKRQTGLTTDSPRLSDGIVFRIGIK